ncbi:MAG: D-amino-acid transaminase [Firmicutes bacterium]|jgi:D-alanine transaminase|nr:D-amino-acid transaminase [Bacillota bacterium]
MPVVAYVDGKFFTDISQAKVSIEDRGYQFGDGVYEVIRSYDGKLFGVQEHMARLERSLREIELELPPGMDIDDVTAIALEALERSTFVSALVYLQVSRGTVPRDHSIPEESRSTLVVTVRPFTPPTQEVWENGFAVVTLPDERWLRCDIKTINLLANVLAITKAKRMGFQEAILIREGVGVTECSRNNLFIVKEGRCLTAPRSNWILPGITRNFVLGLLAENNIPYEEAFFDRETLLAADEVFLAGTGNEVMPITKINDQLINEGKPGPVTRRIAELFREFVQRSI